MRDDPRELGRNDAKNLAPLGDLDSKQPLGAERERDVVADRVEVVFAVGPGDDLVVLSVFADLLEAAVQITDVGNAAHDGLTIELEHQAENSMRRRMLGTDVDEHVIAFEIGLDARRWLESDGGATIVGDERNALRSPLRVETGGRKLYFDRALPTLLARPLAFAQSLAHVLRKILERIGDRELFHRVPRLRDSARAPGAAARPG